MPFKKGNVPWMKGRHHTEETRRKISEREMGFKEWRFKVGGWNKGIPRTEEEKERQAQAMRGRKLSLEHRRKMSRPAWNKGLPNTWASGEKSRFWKGGVTPENNRLRSSLQYKKWRQSVFERDNFTCVNCQRRGSITLHADHIKPFALFPELRFDVGNGRTLCLVCHRKTDTYPKNLLSRATI